MAIEVIELNSYVSRIVNFESLLSKEIRKGCQVIKIVIKKSPVTKVFLATSKLELN